MQLTESKIANKTDTFFDFDGEIVCVVDVKERTSQHGNYFTYWAEYCTGPKAEEGLRHAFYHAEVSLGMAA